SLPSRRYACCCHLCYVSSLFSTDTATPEISTLSLHDALPISGVDLSAIADLSDAKLEKAALALAQAESGLSERRRGVQQVMDARSEEHTSELQSQSNLVCRLLLEKKKHINNPTKNCLRIPHNH